MLMCTNRRLDLTVTAFEKAIVRSSHDYYT